MHPRGLLLALPLALGAASLAPAACRSRQPAQPAQNQQPAQGAQNQQPAQNPQSAQNPQAGAAEGWTRTALGDGLNADATRPAQTPTIAVGRDGNPVVAWTERGQLHAKRWTGSAWERMGAGALNRDANKGAADPSLAALADGGFVLAWTEADANDVAGVCASRWDGAAWQPLGASVRPPSRQPAEGARAAAGRDGPVVLYRERTAEGPRRIHARRWDGAAWQPLGAAALNDGQQGDADGVSSLASTGDGALVVAWRERTPAGVVVHARRWDAAAGQWAALPQPSGADGDSVVDVAATPDGGAVLAMGYNAGLRPLARLAPNGAAWEPIGVPHPALAQGGYVGELDVAAGPSGEVAFVWPAPGVGVARWDGARWVVATGGGASLAGSSTHAPVVAAAGGGRIYVAWTDASGGVAQLRAALWQQAPQR